MRVAIPLRLGNDSRQSSREAAAKALERDILATRSGDWNAKNSLARTFRPLLTSLAEKRADDPKKVAGYIEAGKEEVERTLAEMTRIVDEELRPST